MVALGLFGLIALAGFTLLDGVIGARERLDGRLARTAELQRAMYLVSQDFEALDSGPLELSGTNLGFRRSSATGVGGSTSVQYRLIDGGLNRRVGDQAEQRADCDADDSLHDQQVSCTAHATAAAAKPASSSVVAISVSISACDVPRSQPTPRSRLRRAMLASEALRVL
jgi:hypothetical protein